jgi:hypothetical protein
MIKPKDIIIRRSCGNEDYQPITGSVVLEEGGFYIHINHSNTDFIIPMEVVIDLLKETLMETFK